MKIEAGKNKIKWHHKIIRWLYNRTPYLQSDNLNTLQLTPPKFYKPSVDAGLLFDWHYELHRSYPPYLPNDLAEALKKLVVTEKYEIPNFDFSNISSLSHSKSFGPSLYPARINGSWFADAASWGQAMYPSDNLSGLDDSDWEQNIWYIENREGFSKSRPITINYFEWLNRFVGVQSGGSHHAAMVLHQIKNQKRSYTRHAVVTKYSLNSEELANLLDNYCMFATAGKLHAPKLSDSDDVTIDQAVCEYISFNVYTLAIHRSVNGAVMCFIPYKDLKIGNDVFQQWYKNQIARKTIIPLLDLVDNTLEYCTTPYIHEIHSCHLGDPRRTNDKIAKSISPVSFD
ncbi:DUF6685 family protein [Rheinheimera texasensis]|uniref:DUF6685 family protein n=1 Tax=Rheinheimera texasensis TaxID=306205 RepID=UPI0006892D97|nr:DUF6685 family protein [Rheinheimera texasensis]